METFKGALKGVSNDMNFNLLFTGTAQEISLGLEDLIIFKLIYHFLGIK
jgi:hypothetical protein